MTPIHVTPLRLALSALTVIILGIAVLGIGMGGPPESEDPAPTGAALQASKDRIASGGAMVKEGRAEYAEHGCDACHSIAATGANGKLGPRLDTLSDDSTGDIVGSIVSPRQEIEEGYEKVLMPTDYTEDIGLEGIQAIAAFIKAASGGE